MLKFMLVILDPWGKEKKDRGIDALVFWEVTKNSSANVTLECSSRRPWSFNFF